MEAEHELLEDTDMSNNPGGSGSSTRAARPIASRACETCRNRKSRCDERRPKCSLCQRLNLECVYVEPRATKKDKTLVHILESLQRLERKVDRIEAPQDRKQPFDFNSPPIGSSDLRNLSTTPSDFTQVPVEPVDKFTEPHRVFTWPAIQSLLGSTNAIRHENLPDMYKSGSAFFVQGEMRKYARVLPSARETEHESYNPDIRALPTLAHDDMRMMIDRYFNAYNVIYPILDQNTFMEKMLPVYLSGTAEEWNTDCIIVLLVLALGTVAHEGCFGEPISAGSGIKGGNAEHPPGLSLFEHARRRAGFVFNHNGLSTVQTLLLMSFYFEAASRHLDCWRTITTASEAIRVLLLFPMDYSTHEGDMVRRSYWTCYVLESWYAFDLNLPQTGLAQFQDVVPLPLFTPPHESDPYLTPPLVEFQCNFLAMASLRKIMERIQLEMRSASKADPRHRDIAPSRLIFEELEAQLHTWRATLTNTLRWSDHSRTLFPYFDTISGSWKTAQFKQGAVKSRLYAFHADIVAAQLRGRYYYAMFLLNRPSLYKALHYPEAVTELDKQHCRTCLQSCIQWEIAMSPVNDKKRLMPNNYVWTTSFVTFALVLGVARESVILNEICREDIGEEAIEPSLKGMMEWLRDMKQVEAIAEWGWELLRNIYPHLA